LGPEGQLSNQTALADSGAAADQEHLTGRLPRPLKRIKLTLTPDDDGA
jgi:hypothetical protein